MVHLRWHCYGPCRDCPGHESSKGPNGEIVYGGWICKCSCHNPKPRAPKFHAGPLTKAQKNLLKALREL